MKSCEQVGEMHVDMRTKYVYLCMNVVEVCVYLHASFRLHGTSYAMHYFRSPASLRCCYAERQRAT
jgi:hypothetical protein